MTSNEPGLVARGMDIIKYRVLAGRETLVT